MRRPGDLGRPPAASLSFPSFRENVFHCSSIFCISFLFKCFSLCWNNAIVVVTPALPGNAFPACLVFVFAGSLEKKDYATTIMHASSFCQKCRLFLGIFHCYRPECAIWLFPKIGGLQDSQKKRFLKGFQKQFKQRTIGNHNPEPFFLSNVSSFWACFIAIAQNVPSDCSQKFAGLQDSQKNTFFERVSKAI